MCRLTHLKRFMMFNVDIFFFQPMIFSNKLDLLQVFFSVPEVLHPPSMRLTRPFVCKMVVDTLFRVVIISSRETIILFYPVVLYGMSSLERGVALLCILALFVAIILRHLNTHLTNCL